uniref:Homolog of minus gamete specific protein n=1 Tax=Yamagishiella unicocca TaxID=51707 RepID=A0A2Z5X8A4_9CHLO|nr:homolog of minus gamete specific protein [Yamagishiella unicocca]
MEAGATAGSPQAKLALPSLNQASDTLEADSGAKSPVPAAAAACSPTSAGTTALVTVTDTTTRQLREVQHPLYLPKDDELQNLVRQAASLDRHMAKEAMAKLWQMTVPTRRNRAANQAALVELGGVSMAVDFAVARLAGNATREDEEEAVSALLLLENLSCNTQLHYDMAHDPKLLHFLVTLIREQPLHAIRANAAKVLVNMTFSSAQLQQIVVGAGALPQALELLRHEDSGLVRQGAWLLSHLTAGQGCLAREELGARADVLARLKLLLHSDDRVIVVRVCEVVCNLARGDIGPHANLVRAGVVPALLGLIDPKTDRRQEPAVVAPALLALAALAVGGTAISRSLVLEPQVASHLAGILDYSNLVTRDYDMSRVMMAAHALVFALGTFAVRDKVTASASGTALALVCWPPHVEQLLQESGYVSFPQSLHALGLVQPRYHAASLGKDLGGPHSFVANATHQVNVELLPLLKHDNARMVVNACARLYQIAVCMSDNPEGRAVLTNTSLVVALTDLLSSQHSGVLQAALSLVDALAALPEVVPLLVERGAMDAINDLSDRHQQASAGAGVEAGTGKAVAPRQPIVRSPSGSLMEEVDGPAAAHGGGGGGSGRSDPLVGLLAERALVTMFLAQSARDGLAHAG